jgi:hypothetical protein
MKRGRGDGGLTGGTGDVNPQLLTMSLSTSAANTFTQSTIPFPLSRFGNKKGKAIVVEILKAFPDLPVWDANPAAGGQVALVLWQLATTNQTLIGTADPTVLLFGQKEYRGAFTAAGSYFGIAQEPAWIDFTDGAGHGLLVGTDQVFYGVNTTNFAGAATFTLKILYRFKEVNVEEYIGIVQSQQ